MTTVIFKPFEKYSEKALFIAGLTTLVAGSFLGYILNCRFAGFFSVKTTSAVTFSEVLLDNVYDIVLFTLVLFLMGRAINNKTRLIDILNTAMMARLPLYLLAFTNIGNFTYNLEKKVLTSNPFDLQFTPAEMTILLLISVFAIAALAWSIALLYYGFKTAVNIKTTKHKLLFAVAIIIGEALLNVLLYFIY